MQRLTEELEFASDVMEGKEEKKSQKKADVQDVRDIINQLAAAISKIQSKGKQCIVIIDGVEKASKAKRTEEVSRFESNLKLSFSAWYYCFGKLNSIFQNANILIAEKYVTNFKKANNNCTLMVLESKSKNLHLQKNPDV